MEMVRPSARSRSPNPARLDGLALGLAEGESERDADAEGDTDAESYLRGLVDEKIDADVELEAAVRGAYDVVSLAEEGANRAL